MVFYLHCNPGSSIKLANFYVDVRAQGGGGGKGSIGDRVN
jgi:hypothetical protein